jgi:hypothetical protein
MPWESIQLMDLPFAFLEINHSDEESVTRTLDRHNTSYDCILVSCSVLHLNGFETGAGGFLM